MYSKTYVHIPYICIHIYSIQTNLYTYMHSNIHLYNTYTHAGMYYNNLCERCISQALKVYVINFYTFKRPQKGTGSSQVGHKVRINKYHDLIAAILYCVNIVTEKFFSSWWPEGSRSCPQKLCVQSSQKSTINSYIYMYISVFIIISIIILLSYLGFRV